MPLVSKAAYEKFETAYTSAPNLLTKVLRSHHAIEFEIHATLGMYLALSPRLDLKKIPFLTKVDLLISLGALNKLFYPFFGEVNRIRNRFAHDPDSTLSEEDKNKIKGLYGSCEVNLAPKNWEISTPARAVAALFQTSYLSSRSAYEQVVNVRAQSSALSRYIDENAPWLNQPEPSKERQQIDKQVATFARDLLSSEHPDVEFWDFYSEEKLPATDPNS